MVWTFDRATDPFWRWLNFILIVGAVADQRCLPGARGLHRARVAGLRPGCWRRDLAHRGPPGQGVAAGKSRQLHEGDSHIVLNTTEDPESSKLFHGTHLWLSQGTTADEKGAAANDLFDGKPIRHREVIGNESQKSRKLLPNICYEQGDIASSFRNGIVQQNLILTTS